jgi:hypothetical protein
MTDIRFTNQQPQQNTILLLSKAFGLTLIAAFSTRTWVPTLCLYLFVPTCNEPCVTYSENENQLNEQAPAGVRSVSSPLSTSILSHLRLDFPHIGCTGANCHHQEHRNGGSMIPQHCL